MIWVWIGLGWTAVSIILAPLLGRYIANVADHYPKADQ